MKPSAKLLLLFIFMFSYSRAQIREGKIVYDISYPGTTFDAEVVKNLPSECLAYFNEDMMRMEIALGAGMSNIVIVDNKKQEVHVLTDMAGSKTDFIMKSGEKEQKDDYKVELKDEKRVIAGYECKKAIATDKEGNVFTVWYTNQIKTNNSNWNNQFRNIDGFLMEFTMTQGALSMNMTVRNLSPEKVNPEIFKIPEGYTQMTEEDLKRMGKGK